MTSGSRLGLVALGAAMVLAGCDSSGTSDEDRAVTKVTGVPDACETPPRNRLTGPLGGHAARLSARRHRHSTSRCEWSNERGLLVRVYVDTEAEAVHLLEKLTGDEERESFDVEGAAGAWIAHHDLEEFQDYFAAAQLDGAAYAVEVIGPTEDIPRLAAQRILRAGIRVLRD